MPDKKLQHKAETNLNWRGNAPVSERFDDVYYSAEDGLEETRFVFLKGTDFPDACENARNFVIAETGFGTGLNFLASWQAWKESGAKGTLTFISVEGYPLSESALEEAHQIFPEIAPYAKQLRQAWPPSATGFHPRFFEDGKVRLILMFGDAAQSFSQLTAKIDAWYLDGFAPAKNPEMWSDALMDQIARLSKPGTRFATFTAAGFVKRALLARGFDVKKTPGYGRKRERLVGTFGTDTPPIEAPHIPEWASLAGLPTGKVAVIGAGIAGASVANALKRRGREVIIISPSSEQTASRVPAAILSPRFMLEENPAANFFTSAYAYSCWLPAYREAWASKDGVNLMPKNENDEKRLAAIREKLDWDASWLKEAEEGFHLARGGSVDTQIALTALIEGIPRQHASVTKLHRQENGWQLMLDNGEKQEAAAVVLATGINTKELLAEYGCPELRPNRGQVERLCPPYPLGLPDCSIAYGGYVTAETKGMRTLGSTFDRIEQIEDTSYAPSDDDRQRILDQFERVTSISAANLVLEGSWAGVRATTPDHLPYAGPIADKEQARERYAPLAKDAKITGLGEADLVPGLYMLSGLGSKGYQYGPILGEYLAAQICDEPLPLPNDLIAPLHPLRDLIRSIKRSKS